MMKKIAALLMMLVMLCTALPGNFAAMAEGVSQERYNEPMIKPGIYLYSPIIGNSVYAGGTIGPYHVLPWKHISLSATIYYQDENGLIRTTTGSQWTWSCSSTSTVRLQTSKDSVQTCDVYTIAPSSQPVTIRVSCVCDMDGKSYTGSISLQVNTLTISSNEEPLRCAALSMLTYADLTQKGSGYTIQELLKPADLQGQGLTFDGADSPLLKNSNSSIYATQRDLIVACAGDYKVESIYSKGSFYGVLYTNGSDYIMAFRGTEILDLKDLLSDVKLGLGRSEKEQFVSALDFYDIYKTKKPTLTGHSLGGGLANYVSVMTGARAVTFNAPSTLVTATSNFVDGVDGGRFGQNFRGLNDGLRVDYVNELDWVGKVGVGDSRGNLFTGSGDTKDSGNLDRTVYKSPALNNNSVYPLGAAPNHAVTRMINYNAIDQTISLTATTGATGPKQYSFTWKINHTIYNTNAGGKYYFGSVSSDNISAVNDAGEDYVQVYAGDGDDTITLLNNAPEFVVPGRGNDIVYTFNMPDNTTINNRTQYFYYQGDGYDTIVDHTGEDTLKVYGFTNIEVQENTEEKFCYDVVDASTQTKLVKVVLGPGSGSFTVINEKAGWEKRIYRSYLEDGIRTTYTIHCPVSINIYNADNQLVAVVPDGAEASGAGDFGYYSAYATDNGYGKSVTLASEDYRLQIVGVDEGVMRYSCAYDDGESTVLKEYDGIPVYAGALYYPASMTDSYVLMGDLNGDGTIDYLPTAQPVEDLALPESLSLAFGRMQQLEATGTGHEGVSYVWWSDDPEIVTVSQDGVVVAVGCGETTVHVKARDGAQTSASCVITVPEEYISITDAQIAGVEDRVQYTGEAYLPELSVTFRDLELRESRDYCVEYCGESDPGAYAISIVGLGAFADEASVSYEIYEESYDSAEACADAVVQQMQAEGITGEYNQAVWLHDWLVHHANYDYTYTYYTADGVLLYGTGVCQSYTLAYGMLLDRVGIENRMVSSAAMNHAWNLVRIEGSWCHIDCTWDDPGTGGNETHTYFGMSDLLLSRDHQWDTDGFPAADSLNNYYPLRQGSLCYASDEELDAILTEQASAQNGSFTLVYVGADAAHRTAEAFEKWFTSNNWKYGLRSYGASYTDYECTVQMEYTDPWEPPQNHLDEPVPAPGFSLSGPEGSFALSRYGNNGIMLIFGQIGCSNTASLLDSLTSELSALNDGGVEVLVCISNAAVPGDLSSLQEAYPGVHFTYNSAGLLWSYLQAVGHPSGSVTYPCVFMINSDAMITYYSTGYVSNMDELIGEAFSNATGNALPQPEKPQDSSSMNGQGNVNNIADGESVVSALQSASRAGHVILVMGEGVYSTEDALMSAYENHYALFSSLNVSMVVALVDVSEEVKANYPHCTFVDYSDNDFWQLLYTTGFNASEAYYRTGMLIRQGGDIAAYTNGSLLDANTCALYAAEQLSYDARIPDGLTEIEAEAFCRAAMARIDLTGGQLQTIQSRAFADCAQLRVVRIPESVSGIAEDAFQNCDSMIIICTMGSAAYQYAVNHGIEFLCE